MATRTYEQVITAAGSHWVTGDIDNIINTEYLGAQVVTIADAFGEDRIKVREDILDSAGIYRNLQWDGVRVPQIESESSPWVEDEFGGVFDFGGDGFRSLTSGVLVSGTEIQMDDSAAMVDDFTDLHAARIAAAEVTRITGRPHTVNFHGTY